MTRVIHTGDTHIGYQQYNSPDRRTDFLSAFRSVVEDAVDDDLDAVVHAGDLFHDRRPGLVDLQGTIDVLRTLEAASIPFLAIVGNHETKRDAQWLDLFADLGLATRLGAEPVTVGDVAFYGLDYVPQSRRDALSYDFAPRPDGADTAVLVAHGLFEPFAHATWDTEHVLEESSVDFDAVLLGDNHAADTAEVNDTWVTYCGSTERASANERDPRGYNLVTFEEEVSLRRRSISGTRDFAFVDVELAEGEGIDRVRERLSQHDLEDAVVIVTIEGDGEPVSPAPIEEYATERGALVARANDRRELAVEDEAVQVSFADPDTAVTERLRELEPSDGTLAIDRTVRDDAIADSNVRETVERRVRDALSEDGLSFADPPSLEPETDDPGEPVRQEDGRSTDASSPADTEPAGEADSAGPAADQDPAESEPTADDSATADSPRSTAAETDGSTDEPTESDTSADERAAESTDPAADANGDPSGVDDASDGDADSDDGDGQVSIGDFA